LFENLLNSQ